MRTNGTQCEVTSAHRALLSSEPEHWYALHVRSRHEKQVAHRLSEAGVHTFLPLVTEVHRWSDRKKTVELPLFGCYVFAKISPKRTDRIGVLRVDGVLSVVGNGGEGSAIPEEQINAVRITLGNALNWTSHPFLRIGQRVRIRGGALEGMEGKLVNRNGADTFVISVDALERSLAVRVEGYQIEKI